MIESIRTIIRLQNEIDEKYNIISVRDSLGVSVHVGGLEHFVELRNTFNADVYRNEFNSTSYELCFDVDEITFFTLLSGEELINLKETLKKHDIELKE